MNVAHGTHPKTQGQRLLTQGQVFTFTKEEVEALNVMIDTLLLNSKMLAHVLFDIGALTLL